MSVGLSATENNAFKLLAGHVFGIGAQWVRKKKTAGKSLSQKSRESDRAQTTNKKKRLQRRQQQQKEEATAKTKRNVKNNENGRMNLTNIS